MNDKDKKEVRSLLTAVAGLLFWVINFGIGLTVLKVFGVGDMSWIYIWCPTLTIIGGISAFFVGYPIVSTIATIAVSIYKKLKYRYGRCRCIDSDRK